MTDGSDLSTLYKLRDDFTIIALTGRIGSGYGIVANRLETGFGDGTNFPDPAIFPSKHNSYRKYRIIYNYAKHNFKPFKRISYQHVLTLFILKHGFEAFISFLNSTELQLAFQDMALKVTPEFAQEIALLDSTKKLFVELQSKFLDINFDSIRQDNNLEKLYDIFFNDAFVKFSVNLHEIIRKRSKAKGTKLIQIIANNLRKSGNPYNTDITNPDNIFTVVDLINLLIKSYKEHQKGEPTKIVIDTLKNPLEIMFFRQRFAAFYSIAISREDIKRVEVLKLYKEEFKDISLIADEEYKPSKGNHFYKQFVRECIEKADIHISFKTLDDIKMLNEIQGKEGDNASPHFSWQMQLLKYIALISHPGLVTPSPEERCMQLAITAKYNSGCISRQVGATITDENYSIKAIGWNNTPEGQVPCSLRNAEDLITGTGDLDAFTPYEKNDSKFRDALKISFPLSVIQDQSRTKGKSACFCFKTLKNSYSEGKNQVHTRSLHAEESAFLQITKYGGTGIKGGKLFTTASPCELCSKKAYQLGISIIYYIDPYPGISQEQILNVGDKHPTVRLFNGAIGNAYNWLYEPLMNYKDEQSLIFGTDIKDLTSKQKEIIKDQEAEILQLKAQVEDLLSQKL
jgi:deoxycytidylate deaminase